MTTLLQHKVAPSRLPRVGGLGARPSVRGVRECGRVGSKPVLTSGVLLLSKTPLSSGASLLKNGRIGRHRMQFAAFMAILVFMAPAWGSIVTFTSEAAWDTAVANGFATETFDATGLKPFTGVATSTGAIGAPRGTLTGSVWTDRLVTGGTTTTFTYEPGQIFGAGATWDTSPGGEGQGLIIIDPRRWRATNRRANRTDRWGFLRLDLHGGLSILYHFGRHKSRSR